jgi:hypothetical protein
MLALAVGDLSHTDKEANMAAQKTAFRAAVIRAIETAIEIVLGPMTYGELSESLGSSQRAPHEVVFTIAGKAKETFSVRIIGIESADGSGERWVLKAVVLRGSKRVNVGALIEGYYSTLTRKGNFTVTFSL